MNLETPSDFLSNKQNNKHTVLYTNLRELVQGGPEVGNININGWQLSANYGGPCLIYKDFLFVPEYQKKLFNTGFKLVAIDINKKQIKYLTPLKNLIYLIKIEDNKLYYSTNLNIINLESIIIGNISD